MTKDELLILASESEYENTESENENLILTKGDKRLIIWADGKQITTIVGGKKGYNFTKPENVYKVAAFLLK